MNLTAACSDILSQLNNLITEIKDDDYVRPSASLGGSTIGQHLRHTLEFFICLQAGLDSGCVNYDERKRDVLLESDKYVALSTIEQVKRFVSELELNRSLSLTINYDLNSDASEVITSTTARELVYNIEHAVHHMALMKIGIREVAPYLNLAPSFGVAASTVRYQQNIGTSA